MNLCLEEIRPVKVLVLQKWRAKVCILSPHVRCSEKTSRGQNGIWKIAKDIHQVLKIFALGMPPTSLNAALNTHSAIAFQHSSRVTTTFNAHCTVRCVVGDFSVILAKKYEARSVRYRTVRWAWYHVSECNVLDQRITGSLAWESNEIAETGGTLLYTVNPFRYYGCLVNNTYVSEADTQIHVQRKLPKVHVGTL